MSTEPHTPTGAMTPIQAAHVAGRARKLLRAGKLTAHDYACLDALLWGARKPSADSATAAYSSIARLAHVARGTVAKAVGRFRALGLVAVLKRRVLVLWNNGGRAWRQLANSYRFIRCEYTGRPEYQKEEIKIVQLEPTFGATKDAQEGLAAVRQRRARLLFAGR